MSDFLSVLEGVGLSLLVKGDIYKFCSTVFGESAEKVAEIIRNEIRCFNGQRTAVSFAKAYKKLEEAGINPQEVTMKILLPILDGISLEEDIELQSMWSNLLASAAAGVDIHPSYSDVLRSISSSEARILNKVFDLVESDICNSKDIQILLVKGIKCQELKTIDNLSDIEFKSSIDNLVRLNLCQQSVEGLRPSSPLSIEKLAERQRRTSRIGHLKLEMSTRDLAEQIFDEIDKLQYKPISIYEKILLTNFGYQCIKAWSGPKNNN
jgi:Abortive infection alpha